jgi:hypothetical protein
LDKKVKKAALPINRVNCFVPLEYLIPTPVPPIPDFSLALTLGNKKESVLDSTGYLPNQQLEAIGYFNR